MIDADHNSDHGCCVRRCCIWSDSSGEGESRIFPFISWDLTDEIQKYLVPHLQPPSTNAFQSTSAEITAQYDEAAKLMAELSEQTGKLQSTLDEDRYVVNS